MRVPQLPVDEVRATAPRVERVEEVAEVRVAVRERQTLRVGQARPRLREGGDDSLVNATPRGREPVAERVREAREVGRVAARDAFHVALAEQPADVFAEPRVLPPVRVDRGECVDLALALGDGRRQMRRGLAMSLGQVFEQEVRAPVAREYAES